MRNFKRYSVVLKSHQLTLDLYRDTREFPEFEIYGITSQLRRACASIPTNIAEGCGRDKEYDLARFLDIAMGSAKEVEYLLTLAKDLGYMKEKIHQERNGSIAEIQRMLTGFLATIRKSAK